MRIRPQRSRATRILAVATLLAGLVITTSAVDVGAAGTMYTLATVPRRDGLAVEGAARVTFSCNEAGVSTLSVRNVSVISDDGTTAWGQLTPGVYDVGVRVSNMDPQQRITWHLPDLVLTQNSKNGLFGGTLKGSSTSAARVCVTGASLNVADQYTGGTYLHFADTLLT